MCLATVYKESDDTVICRNVSKILVEGEKVIIRDIINRTVILQCCLRDRPSESFLQCWSLLP